MYKISHYYKKVKSKGNKMNESNKIIRTFKLSLIALSVPFIAACSENEKSAVSHGPLPVSASEAKSTFVPKNIEIVGQAEGSKEIEIHARIGGILEEQRHMDGQPVKKGDILYLLDKEPLVIDVEKARARAMEAVARTKQAMREEARLATLYAGKAISQRDYEAAVSEREMAQAAQVAAKADLKESELKLSYATVKAPISGVVGKAEKSVGSLITVGNTSLLTTMVQVDPIWVNFSLSLEDLGRLGLDKSGISAVTNVTAIMPDGGIYPTSGIINFMDSKVNYELNTIQMRAEFKNPDGAIRPGQFVRVKLDAGNYENAFLVPQSAVMQSENGRFVYTINDNRVTVTPVKTGPWSGDDWVITDGLKDGDNVIVDNLIKVSPGSEVSIKANIGGENNE